MTNFSTEDNLFRAELQEIENIRNALPNPYHDFESKDWWHPEQLSVSNPTLNEEQLDRFHSDGFIVLDGLWPTTLIEQASLEVARLHPPQDVIKKGQKKHQVSSAMPWHEQKNDGGNITSEWALNYMTINHRALAVISQLLETDAINIRLSQSHIIAKYGAKIDGFNDPNRIRISGDQEMHVDYGNNTLMVPPRTSAPEAIACLSYYSNVNESGGATHFAQALPGELTSYSAEQFNPPGFVGVNGTFDFGPRSKENIERLYEIEKPVYYKHGTCILYRLDTWHRGTPAALGKIRYSHHHVWRHKNAEWVNWQSLAPKLSRMSNRYLEQMSVLQRTVLGFAPPGNAYWTEETLNSVGQRYPGMDMTPYRKAKL